MTSPGGPQVSISARDCERLLDSWRRRSGRIVEFPRRLKPRLIALHYLLGGFESGVSYTEESVNTTIISRNLFALDHVNLRRQLVDYGMLGRTASGHEYRVARTYLARARWGADVLRHPAVWQGRPNDGIAEDRCAD